MIVKWFLCFSKIHKTLTERSLGRFDWDRPFGDRGSNDLWPLTYRDSEWDPTCYHDFRKGLLWLQVSKRSSCRDVQHDLSISGWTWRPGPEDLDLSESRLAVGPIVLDVDVEHVEWLRKQPLLVQRKETLWGPNQSFSFHSESSGSSQADRIVAIILEGSGSTGTGSGQASGFLVPNMFWKHPELTQNNNPEEEPSLDPEVSPDSWMSWRPAGRSWNRRDVQSGDELK